MSKKITRDKRLLVAGNMPRLRKTIPGEAYSHERDEVLKWISETPELLAYVFDKLASWKYIAYDSDTSTWQGVNNNDD